MGENNQDSKASEKDKYKIQESQNRKTNAKTFFESSTAITFIAASLYLVGKVNLVGYYGYFTMALPGSLRLFDYITRGFLTAANFYVALLISFSISRKRPRSFWATFSGNLPILVLPLYLPYFVGWNISERGRIFSIIFLASILVWTLLVAIFSYFRYWSIAHYFYKMGLPGKLAFLLVVSLFFAVAAFRGSRMSAMQLIELGKEKNFLPISSHSQIVSITLNNNNNQFKPEKELVFIEHQDGNYYIAEKISPAPESPVIYIIPEREVKYIRIGESNSQQNDK